MDDVNADAAAALGGLDHQGETQPPSGFGGFAVGNRFVGAGQHRQSGFPGQLAGNQLVAHLLHNFGARADESNPGLLALAGETGIFRQEPVAGMNRLGPGAASGVQDFPGVEVTILRGGAAQQHRFIGLAHRQGTGVYIGIHRDGADTQPPASADDAASDFPPVGD